MWQVFSQILDIWSLQFNTFMSWPKLQDKFMLLYEDRPHYESMVARIPPRWIDLFTSDQIYTDSQEFLGVFAEEDDAIPVVVFKTSPQFCPQIRSAQIRTCVLEEVPCFAVGQLLLILHLWPQVDLHEDVPFDGLLKNNRIITMPHYNMCVGVISDLHFDPGRYLFGNASPLHTYIVKGSLHVNQACPALSIHTRQVAHGVTRDIRPTVVSALVQKSASEGDGILVVSLSLRGVSALLARTSGTRDLDYVHELHCRA